MDIREIADRMEANFQNLDALAKAAGHGAQVTEFASTMRDCLLADHKKVANPHGVLSDAQAKTNAQTSLDYRAELKHLQDHYAVGQTAVNEFRVALAKAEALRSLMSAARKETEFLTTQPEQAGRGGF